jgi:hypothetical protein
MKLSSLSRINLLFKKLLVYRPAREAQKLTGDNLKVVLAEFSTLS